MTDSYADRLVDEDALRAYLVDALGSTEEFAVRRHRAGHSNETLFVTHGDDEYVLRRPPAGETAEKAHDVLREYQVMDALQDTPVPLPETVLACDDERVIGAEFFLMARLDGDVIRDAEPERFGTADARERVGEELVDSLSAIHDVDPAAVGLRQDCKVSLRSRATRWSSSVTTSRGSSTKVPSRIVLTSPRPSWKL